MPGAAPVALVAMLAAPAVLAAPPDLATVRTAYRSSESVGTIVALDPDIPASQERIALRSSGAGPGGSWRIDGRPAGDSDAVTLWMPAPGRHRLALLDASGREADAVRFEVRGAPYSAPVR